MNPTARHIIVKGKVQGVFFRKETRQVAELLNITGWVKNRNDGAVEILAQGGSDMIQQLISWCWHGPPRAEVKVVEVTDAKPDYSITGFSIKH